MHGALGAAFLFVVAGGTAQVPHAWTFDELTAKADLVIIASHLSTQDTGRRRMDPELKPGARAAELRTELKVLQVLKADSGRGVAAGATVSLRHYSVLEPPFSMGSTLKFGESARAYLVFLARKPDGVYEPVSGQVFPADSVYLLDRSDHIPPPLPPSLPNMSGTWVLINVNDAPRDAARELVVTQDPRVFGVSAAAGAIPMSRTYALGVSGGVVSSDGGRQEWSAVIRGDALVLETTTYRVPAGSEQVSTWRSEVWTVAGDRLTIHVTERRADVTIRETTLVYRRAR